MKRGFTLIEMMVVFAIMVIIFSIAIWNYRSSNKTIILNQEAARVAGDIRRIQAMAGKDNAAFCSANEDYDSSYGIRFEKDLKQYKIFADCDNGRDYDNGELIETVDLNSSVKITIGAAGDKNTADIVFTPPDPAVKLKEDGADQAQITINIVVDPVETVEQKKSVIINKLGMIDVD